MAVAEDFIVIPRSLPGLPQAGKSPTVDRFRSYVAADNRHYKLFMSYRRADDTHSSGRILDRLVSAFGEGSVFRDVDAMPLGSRLTPTLEQFVGKSELLVVLVGKGWLGKSVQSESPRLFDKDDPVRVEIETALKVGIPIVPVLMAGATAPTENDVPPSLCPFANRPFMVVRPDPHFESDINTLIERCNSILGSSGTVRMGLHIPELDGDLIAPLRVLTASGLRILNFLDRMSENSGSIQDAFAIESDQLLSVESVIQSWCHYIGDRRDEAHNSNLPNLVDEIERVLVSIDALNTSEWRTIQDSLGDTDGRGEPSKSQVFAMSAAQILSQHFAFIRRARRAFRFRANPLDAIAMHGRASFSRQAPLTFVAGLWNEDRHVIERICDTLEQSLGDNIAFSHTIRYGAVDARQDTVPEQCATYLLLVGDGLLSLNRKRRGGKAIADQIAKALTMNIAFVPVLLPGATIPRRDRLPDAIKPILNFNFAEIREDPYYAIDMERIISVCRGMQDARSTVAPLVLPDRLPLYSTLPITVLCRSCRLTRDVLLAVLSKAVRQDQAKDQRENPVEIVKRDNRDLFEKACWVLKVWGTYFHLEEVDTPSLNEI
ncbi:MAG: toll/interleukin-1 receptor domain-containing protein [Bryobacterales bacterium]|nr:toll/interleukin-1 receptor domain-containing protein [Bryobacterales bacterium]